jgi:hypothetical protein
LRAVGELSRERHRLIVRPVRVADARHEDNTRAPAKEQQQRAGDLHVTDATS